MILGRYPFAALAFAEGRLPEVISTSVGFSETETLDMNGALVAGVPVAFSETETLAAAGKIVAASAVAIEDVETLEVGSAVTTDKFLALLHQATARRVYVMEMTIKQFR